MMRSPWAATFMITAYLIPTLFGCGPGGAPSADTASDSVDELPIVPASAPRKSFPDAVDLHLEWLFKRQCKDGGWEAHQVSDESNDPKTTGIVLTCFLGSGYTNRGKSSFSHAVGRGLRRLKQLQEDDGSFGSTSKAHVCATLAMVDAYGMTGSAIYKPSAQRAVDRLALMCENGQIRDAESVGWSLLILMGLRFCRNIRPENKETCLQWDEASFDRLQAWTEVDTDCSDLDRSVAALARIMFDPLEEIDERLRELTDQLVARPFSVRTPDARPLSSQPFSSQPTSTNEKGMTNPLAAVFTHQALRYSRGKSKLAWREASQKTVHELRESRRKQPKGAVQDIVSCALCVFIDSRPDCYSAPDIKNIR